MIAIYEIIVLPKIGKVAEGNLPDRANSMFHTYAKLARPGQIVELRRNGALVKVWEKSA